VVFEDHRAVAAVCIEAERMPRNDEANAAGVEGDRVVPFDDSKRGCLGHLETGRVRGALVEASCLRNLQAQQIGPQDVGAKLLVAHAQQNPVSSLLDESHVAERTEQRRFHGRFRLVPAQFVRPPMANEVRSTM
jgi:hypothetical protein